MTATLIFATSIFTFFAGIGLFASIAWTLNNNKAFEMLSKAAGFDLNKTAAADEQTGKAMKFLLIDFTSQMSGLNLFALLIIWIPFQNGELWAWAALWFYPLMFAWHYLHYAKGTKFSIVQIVYCVLSSAALILSYPG